MGELRTIGKIGTMRQLKEEGAYCIRNVREYYSTVWVKEDELEVIR